MKVTVELSLYPLHPEPIEKILDFIGDLRANERLEVVVNQMSTQVRGELRDVMTAITGCVERSFGAGGSQALVMKVLNADLPIGESPVLERA